ncbi:MAG TPA: tRNA (adenosine(37)-N6)-threonylcarbamoyltransferase complex ATPase subunit type 1 TsaE [Flavobacteriales bacterium]|nr:tRNA (adenosine(37)-N6)-threonylcarbamoyltransferase complex ATPase subunit type 1 TsaE [Flavobacteriales bacterium]HMW98591.1 tRNA (adenosine(37)-N6)-threonylcarbamoyltransferase complex ATPase subunit type 1 TsaE [Flavobacteriales bacterium]HNI04152.1 tRNA (adenosine(37)-N6)-threonylcarbamoyltransferase complex ATPase subunit type 1 TsaE [Flavobacteriales bacterium]HNK42517.1 tRNA (adenosine(37)-N6)-threonylcarbamoyltransferase complex ATPase subunit type 1 TsaE [Flavobacteriales bacterium]
MTAPTAPDPERSTIQRSTRMSTIMPLDRADEAADLAAAMLNACKGRRVFAFQGELGTGKTTLIKALCDELGVAGGTSSPSFGIVNEYRTSGDEPVYHFDLYRLKDAVELDGIGFMEYIDSGRYCFVEWPEVARNLLPSDAVRVRLKMAASGGRTVELAL